MLHLTSEQSALRHYRKAETEMKELEEIVPKISLLNEPKFGILNTNYQKSCHEILCQEICWLCLASEKNAKLMSNKAREDQCGSIDEKKIV